MRKRGIPWQAHLLHAVMTMCTGGLWGIVWWFHWASSGPPSGPSDWRLWR